MRLPVRQRIISAMSTPSTTKLLLLVADRPTATPGVAGASVRRYRLARLRLEAPAGDGAPAFEQQSRATS
jgi:hypothetical protein